MRFVDGKQHHTGEDAPPNPIPMNAYTLRQTVKACSLTNNLTTTKQRDYPFGVTGYSTLQHFLAFKHEGSKYNGDLVIYLFYQNDLNDIQISSAKKYPRPLFEKYKEHIKIHRADDVVNYIKEHTKNPSYFKSYKNDYNKDLPPLPPQLEQWLRKRSHFFTLFFNTLQRKEQDKEKEFKQILDKVSLTQEALLRTRLETDPAFNLSFDAFTNTVILFNNAVNENNAEFVIINIPSPHQIKQESRDVIIGKRVYADRVRKGIIVKPWDAHYLLESFTDHNSIHYIDLTETALENQEKFHWRTDPHWSPLGTRVSAKHVAQQFEKMGLLPNP